MSPIRLIRGAAFDPETIQLMGSAYEKATVGLDEISDREIVAERIQKPRAGVERDLGTTCGVSSGRPPIDGIADAAG